MISLSFFLALCLTSCKCDGKYEGGDFVTFLWGSLLFYFLIHEGGYLIHQRVSPTDTGGGTCTKLYLVLFMCPTSQRCPPKKLACDCRAKCQHPFSKSLWACDGEEGITHFCPSTLTLVSPKANLAWQVQPEPSSHKVEMTSNGRILTTVERAENGNSCCHSYLSWEKRLFIRWRTASGKRPCLNWALNICSELSPHINVVVIHVIFTISKMRLLLNEMQPSSKVSTNGVDIGSSSKRMLYFANDWQTLLKCPLLVAEVATSFLPFEQ